MLTLRTFGGLTIDHAPFLDGAAARRRPLAVLALLAVAGPRGMSRDKSTIYFQAADSNRVISFWSVDLASGLLFVAQMVRRR